MRTHRQLFRALIFGPVGPPLRLKHFAASHRVFLPFVALAICFAASNNATATEPVMKVEEDWKVELNTPDPDDQSPQVITTVSPNGSVSGVHAVFELNHASMPEYDAGGMQLQAWTGDTFLGWDNSRRSSLLQQNDELITFTVSTTVYDDWVRFTISNGHSTTWGTFGKYGNFTVWVPSSLSNLNSYDDALSVAKSRVGFASHRVKKFSRLAVRKYSGDGDLLSTTNNEQVVHQHESEE